MLSWKRLCGEEMRLFGLNRHRSETLLLAIGQLILIAYVFQVAALDHWATNPADIAGIPDSSAHSALHSGHCHGAPSSCAEAGGGFAQFSADQYMRLPSSVPSLAVGLDDGLKLPEDTFIDTIPEPPRAA